MLLALQCATLPILVLLLVSGLPLVESNVGSAHSPTSDGVSLDQVHAPARTTDVEAESALGPWTVALAAALIGLWFLMPAPRPASSEQEMKSKRAEKFGIPRNPSQASSLKSSAPASAVSAQVPRTQVVSSAAKSAGTCGRATGSNAGLAEVKVQTPAWASDRHFFVNGQAYRPGSSALSLFTPSSNAQSASSAEKQRSREELPSTEVGSSSARGKLDSSQAAVSVSLEPKAEPQRLKTEDGAASKFLANQPASVDEVKPQSLRVRLRFMAGAQDEEVAVDASWTVAHWTGKVAEMPQLRSKSSSPSFQLVFAGRVLGQTPDAILGKLFGGPGVPVVLVVERGASTVAKSSPSRAPARAGAPTGASSSSAGTAKVITVSREEAASRLWASLGLRWARSQRGNPPPGAAVCGHSAAGGPLYLARGRHAGGMVIGEAGQGRRGCHIAYDNQQVVLTDFEVLCMGASQNGVRMRFAAPAPGVHLHVPAGAVPLGWEADGAPLYGARAAHAKGFHLGKMRSGLGCRIAYAGTEVQVPHFEVLCFGWDDRPSRSLPVEVRPAAAVAAPASTAPKHVKDSSSSGSSRGSSDGSSSGSGSESGEDSSSEEDSGSESGEEDDELLGMVVSFGVHLPLPAACRMNDMVEAAHRKLPREILACLPEGSTVTKLKKRSDGWHEGYEVALRTSPVPRVFCRIWRSEVGYHRLEVPVGPEIELKAMQLAQAAGLPTPRLLDRGAGLTPPVGTCNRGDARPASFALFAFVEGAAKEKVAEQAVTRSGPRWLFELSLMVKLHQYSLGPAAETAPLARFESWREQLKYLTDLAAQCGGAYSQAALAAVAVQQMFALAEAGIPELPPALSHLDWHLGNVLVSDSGELLSVLDWEFAGIGDPRFELARYVRLLCFKEDDPKCRPRRGAPTPQDIWEQYSTLRFGQPASQRLGPLEPWLALECLAVLVFASVMCVRTAAAGDAAGTVEPHQVNYLPRCDLVEWAEDMQTAICHLRNLGLLS